MSSDIIQQFIDAMSAAGCAPAKAADILPTGKWIHFQIVGDRATDKKGYCSFKIDGDFASGNFGNRRDGITHNWHTKSNKKWTKQERDAWQRRVDAERKAADAERLKTEMQAADDAKATWDLWASEGEHPYLTKKGIPALVARVHEDKLLIPAYDINGKLWQTQEIGEDGFKLFQKGARIKGCFCPLGNVSADTLIICEGYATAVSIRLAFPDITVIAAFTAGNLMPVADALRGKYPKTRLIFAADNDAFTERGNTGRDKAEQAATKVRAQIIWPEFKDIITKPTDFDDLRILEGLEAVRSRIEEVTTLPLHEAPQSVDDIPPFVSVEMHPLGGDADIPDADYEDLVPVDYPSDNLSPAFDDAKILNTLIWKKLPSNGRDGKLEPNSTFNIQLYLRHHHKYRGIFRYDRFARRVIVAKQPFWHTGGEPFRVREIRDNDTEYMTASMEKDGLAPSAAKIRSSVEVVAHENWINPPLQYFNSLKWDGKERLSKWIKYYLGAEGDDGYLSAVGMAWLIAGVARVYEPGCKAENMLVLEGNQGLLKSTALSVLANVGRGKDEESYFCDTLGFDQIQDKDTVMKLQGKLIVEIPDLAGLGSREIEAVKAWMSVQCDEIRVPYGREMAKFPRQFILGGSTNETHWMKDLTGNRRFWPVKCGKIDIEALKHDREQLWAEAVHLYKNKAIWWIGRDNPIWHQAHIEQGGRVLEDIWLTPVEKYVERMDFITVAEVLSNLGIEIKDQNSKHQKQVIGILKQLGFDRDQRRIHGRTTSGWGRKSEQQQFTDLEAVDIEL